MPSREQIKTQAIQKSEQLRSKGYKLNPKAEEAAKQRAFESGGGVRGVGGVFGARMRRESATGGGIRANAQASRKKKR